MSDKPVTTPKLEIVTPTPEELDEEEREFRALRRDLPGVKGASAAGIVSIGVAKIPGKNEFFRTHPDFRPVIPLVDTEVGMERQYFAVTDSMIEALASIGISVTNHVLYLTVTARGAYKLIPVRCAGPDGEQNEYARTKELGLLAGIHEWVRLYTDLENRCYKVFPAPAGRFADPLFPELKPAKIFRLAFRDKGRLLDSPEHALFQSGPRVIAMTLGDYEQVIFADFEFIARPGEHPDVVCLAWHEWPGGQTHTLWRDELGTQPPYRTDDKVLFVCFVGNAELACHLALGWPLPVNVLDLSAEFRNHVNGRITPHGKGLLGALAYFNLDFIGSKRKDAARERIMRGWPFAVEERTYISTYAVSDIDALVRLLAKLQPHLDLPIALHRGAFVAVSAQMEHVGVPIDMEIYPLLADKAAWRYVRDAMVPEIDAQYGVYTRGKDGEWHFSMELFAAYLKREGIAWPVTESGTLSTKRKTFEDMSKGHPQLENLRQLRHARDKMRKVKLAVGADGRNRTVLWPFQSKTSRSQPKASQWIFSPAVWLRSLIKPGPGQAVAYIDWSSMEFMVGACQSEDPVMLNFYRNGDPYLSFARRVGAAPPDATKRTHEALRDRYKTGLLAIQYGIQAESLSGRLGVSTFAAHEMICQHRELFAVYWRGADDWLAAALDSGEMRTVLDWRCRTGVTEFNSRSIQNWPVQAAGAEILRIACIWAARRGLRLCAPVHDAVMIEAPIERIEADVALMRELMRRASRVVLNATADGTYELRTDATIIRYPDRYSDKRGAEIWDRVLRLLDEYRAHQLTAEAREAG